MPQAVSILFGAVFTAGVCVALGKLLLRRFSLPLDAREEHVFAFGIGAATLSTLVFFLCAVGAARRGVFATLGIAVLAWSVLQRVYRPQGKLLPASRIAWRWVFGVVFVVYAVLYFFNAMAPEISPDGSGYHLGLAARYLRHHGFERITTNMYASLPQGAEMLFLFAFAFGGHSAAALVHFAFLLALPWAMVLYGRRFGFEGAGMCGALLVFASPVVGVAGASAYNDVALACVLFLLFYLLQIWASLAEDARDGLVLPALAGLLAGFAYAIKYTGFLALPYALAFIAWKSWPRRRQMARTAVAIAVVASVVMAPWAVKNWLAVGNPFSPFFNAVFPNPYVHLSFEQEYGSLMRSPATWGLKSAVEIPWALAIGGSLTGVLGPVLLLAPLGLIALRWPAGRQLIAAAAVFGATYAANLGCRFLIPAWPFLALALGLVFARIRGLAPAVVLAHALVCWPGVLHRQVWGLRNIPVREALRIRSEDAFLSAQLRSYRHARMVERLAPPNGKVLALGDIAEAYTSREILVPYEAAANETARDVLFAACDPRHASTRRLQFRFPEQPLRRIRVVQTTPQAPEYWSVHELRVFREAVELPRAAHWRLQAYPNPWDVHMAFDNSPVTRWRSWQPLFAGMFMEVNFGSPEPIDAVLIECSEDQPHVRLRLEAEAAVGGWRVLADKAEAGSVPLRSGLRDAAMRELKLRGIDHVLVSDTDELADDLRVHTAAWGVVEIGEADGARLYRLR